MEAARWEQATEVPAKSVNCQVQNQREKQKHGYKGRKKSWKELTWRRQIEKENEGKRTCI